MRNLEDYVDYGQFYGRFIDDPKYNPGKAQQALRCPFPDHDDRNESFSLKLSEGKFNCFGCGRSGNAVTFLANMEGMSTKDAYKRICEDYSIPRDEEPRQETKGRELAPLTLAEYAAAKHIDQAFLASRFLLKDAKLGGVDAVAMPYLTKDVHLFRNRMRAGAKAMRWGKKGQAWEDGKTPLYGIHLLQDGEAEVVLVEGESDTQSLRFMGLAAVGAAGASMFNDANAESLAGREVVVHDDGDKGGAVFVSKVAAKLGREVRRFRCRDIDRACKDPSDVLVKYGKERGAQLIREAVRNARAVEPTREVQAPAGYFVGGDGVFKDGRDGYRRVTSTPMELRSVVRCVETGVEKLEIGYAVRGERRSKVFPRDVALNSRKVVEAFSPLGVNVSSANAKDVVEYLTACDAEQGPALPLSESVPRLGWVGEERFAPIESEGLLLDLDEGLAQRAAFVKESGDLGAWAAAMEPGRAVNVAFRFLLAASFASPLVRIVGGRPMFVHVWESSRGGKTAALKAALSVWGDPARLMTTFRSTLNAMCSLAELMCDLPVGIDERQMVQGARQQEVVEEAVYTLAGGHRKDRSTVTGGLQRSGVWNCVFLTTGEVPLLEASTMTGAATRTLELNEKPFASEADAKYMHDATSRLYGTAGRAYLDEVRRMGWNGVRDLHGKMLGELDSLSPYADMVALVGIADYIASKACFGDDDWEMSAAMAREVLAKLKTAEDIDVNRAAVEYLAEWISRHARDFDNAYANGPDLGTRDGMKTCIYRSAIAADMAREGFNVNKTLKYMADKGLIEYEQRGVKRQYTLKVSRRGVRARMIVVLDERLDAFLKEEEAVAC